MNNYKDKFSSKKLFLLVVLIQSTAFAKVEAVLGAVALKDNKNLATEIPTSDLSEIIISREQYVLSYNKERRNPNWVAWKLEDHQIGKSGRANGFTADEDLKNYLAKSTNGTAHPVETSDYTGYCFDRGHQIPSADRTSTVDDNKETFVMSNIVPQTPYLNRVIWEHLEQHTRNLVHSQNKKVYIIAGPIYDQDFGKIGPKADIAVPSKEFKVIIILEANQTPADISASTEIIAVVMPNTLENGDQPSVRSPCPGPVFVQDSSIGQMNDWEKYKTTAQEVQRLSGLRLFPQ